MMARSLCGPWAFVYPHPPQTQGSLARGSGTMVVQPDGTVCIDGSDIQLTDDWGRPFYLRLKMRVYEGLDEVVEKDPHLIGAFGLLSASSGKKATRIIG